MRKHKEAPIKTKPDVSCVTDCMNQGPEKKVRFDLGDSKRASPVESTREEDDNDVANTLAFTTSTTSIASTRVTSSSTSSTKNRSMRLLVNVAVPVAAAPWRFGPCGDGFITQVAQVAGRVSANRLWDEATSAAFNNICPLLVKVLALLRDHYAEVSIPLRAKALLVPTTWMYDARIQFLFTATRMRICLYHEHEHKGLSSRQMSISGDTSSNISSNPCSTAARSSTSSSGSSNISASARYNSFSH